MTARVALRAAGLMASCLVAGCCPQETRPGGNVGGGADGAGPRGGVGRMTARGGRIVALRAAGLMASCLAAGSVG